MTHKYYLSASEQRALRAACKYMRLGFEAQAARPKIARDLIRRYAEIKGQKV